MKTQHSVIMLLCVIGAFVVAGFGSGFATKNGARVIGKLKSDGKIIMTANKSELEKSFRETFNLASVDNIRLYQNDKKVYVLEVSGPLKEEGKYIKLANALELDDTDIILPPGQCTQSCTSVAPCEGCTLNITGDCSGSCSCSSGFGGSCTHTVTSGGIR